MSYLVMAINGGPFDLGKYSGFGEHNDPQASREFATREEAERAMEYMLIRQDPESSVEFEVVTVLG